MSSRIFQSVIMQMKDATDRVVGVIDSDGFIVASGDLSLIGKKIEGLSEMFEISEGITATDGNNTYKALGTGESENYTVFTEGDDELAKTVCILAGIAISEAGIIFGENNDRRAFIKTIISGNIMPGDVFVRAKELHLDPEALRGVLVIRISSASYLPAMELIKNSFPDKQRDYVFNIGDTDTDTDIVVVKEMPDFSETDYLIDLANMIRDKLVSQMDLSSIIGVGTPANHLRELAERYKQALTAIDIEKVFETGNFIISYENLGISRLIYQLPTTLCEIYLSEVFKRNTIEALDNEMLSTIDCFFENSLNVSETARKLFVHRNTLVYRLDKINKVMGLDLREFEHAIVFKVALLVNKYLKSRNF